MKLVLRLVNAVESRYIAEEEQKGAIYDSSNVFVWLPTGFRINHSFLSIFDYNMGLTSAQWKCLFLLLASGPLLEIHSKPQLIGQKKKRAAILSDQLNGWTHEPYTR